MAYPGPQHFRMMPPRRITTPKHHRRPFQEFETRVSPGVRERRAEALEQRRLQKGVRRSHASPSPAPTKARTWLTPRATKESPPLEPTLESHRRLEHRYQSLEPPAKTA